MSLKEKQKQKNTTTMSHRRGTRGQSIHKEVPDLISHQGNVNQDYDEMPLRTHSTGRNKESLTILSVSEDVDGSSSLSAEGRACQYATVTR